MTQFSLVWMKLLRNAWPEVPELKMDRYWKMDSTNFRNSLDTCRFCRIHSIIFLVKLFKNESSYLKTSDRKFRNWKWTVIEKWIRVLWTSTSLFFEQQIIVLSFDSSFSLSLSTFSRIGSRFGLIQSGF